MNRRAVSLIATVGLAAGLVTASAGAAAAYPPGTGLVLTANPSVVLVNMPVLAKASHVRPNCLVTITLGARVIRVRANSGGVAAHTILAPPKKGAYYMKAVVSGVGCPTETAYTRIVATGPVVMAYPSVRHGHLFRVTVARFPAGVPVTVKLIKGRTVLVQHRYTNSLGYVVMYFKTSQTGFYLMLATSGHTYATRVLRVT